MATSALVLVDKDNYVLDGVMHEFPLLDVPLDLASAERSVVYYKQKLVDKGIAFGTLDNVLEENRQDEMLFQDYVEYSMQDPIDAVQALQWGEVNDDEEILSPTSAAFQVLDILFDQDSKSILGRIHIMDTPSGRAARAQVDANMKCMVTQVSIDEIVDRDRRINDGFVLRQFIRKLKGGWRISFEKNETVPSKIPK